MGDGDELLPIDVHAAFVDERAGDGCGVGGDGGDRWTSTRRRCGGGHLAGGPAKDRGRAPLGPSSSIGAAELPPSPTKRLRGAACVAPWMLPLR